MDSRHPFHLIAKPIWPICNIRCEYCFYLSREELFGNKNRFEYAMREDVLERRYAPGGMRVGNAFQTNGDTRQPELGRVAFGK